MKRSLAFAVVAVALASALVACSGSDTKGSGVPSPAGTPSITASSPTSGVPTPTAAPTRVVSKYQDLTLVLLRPATMDPKAGAALEAIQQFDQLFAGMVAGAPTPAEFSKLANPALVKIVNDLLEPQRQAKERGAGQLTIRTTKVKVGTSLMMVDGCFDQTKLVMVRADGTRYVDPTVKRGPTMSLRAMLTKTTGPWRVDEYVLAATKC